MTSHIPGLKAAPKAYRATMESVILDLDRINQWRVPPFQRPVRVNEKVIAIAEEMKTDQVIQGVVTLGKLPGDRMEYIVDGQHRAEAFRLSGLPEVYADLRIVHFESMADMGEEFVRLNSAIVKMRPDDILRGMVGTMPALQHVIKECPFVGFGQVRRKSSDSGPVLSLSTVIRTWSMSAHEAPNSGSVAGSAAKMASLLDMDSAKDLVNFLKLAYEAWGRDYEYFRLWGGLNLCLNMWLYRRLVLDKSRKATARVVVLNDTTFRKCLMSVSTSGSYIEWLSGRNLNDRDRSPALNKLKQIYARRLADEGMGKVALPQPAWVS
jgi:hypothetical protein